MTLDFIYTSLYNSVETSYDDVHLVLTLTKRLAKTRMILNTKNWEKEKSGRKWDLNRWRRYTAVEKDHWRSPETPHAGLDTAVAGLEITRVGTSPERKRE